MEQGVWYFVWDPPSYIHKENSMIIDYNKFNFFIIYKNNHTNALKEAWIITNFGVSTFFEML